MSASRQARRAAAASHTSPTSAPTRAAAAASRSSPRTRIPASRARATIRAPMNPPAPVTNSVAPRNSKPDDFIRLWDQQDLAARLAIVKVVMGGRRVVELEGLVDEGRDLAALVHLHERGELRAQKIEVLEHVPHVHARNRLVFVHQRNGIEPFHLDE